MPVYTKAFTLPTTGSDITFTDTRIGGQSIKAVEVQCSSNTATTGTQSSNQNIVMTGFTEGVSEGCVYGLDRYMVTPTYSHKGSYFGTVSGASSYTVAMPTVGSAGTTGKLRFHSFVDNGVKFTVVEAFAAAYTAVITFYVGGIQAHVGVLAETAAAGNITYSSAPFRGNLLKFTGAHQGSNAGASEAMQYSYGFASGNTSRDYGHFFAQASGSNPSQCWGKISYGHSYVSISAIWEVESWADNGFTVAQTFTGTTSKEAMFLLLKMDCRTNIVPHTFKEGGTGLQEIKTAGFTPTYWEALTNLKNDWDVLYNTGSTLAEASMSGVTGRAWHDGASGISMSGYSYDSSAAQPAGCMYSTALNIPSADGTSKMVGAFFGLIDDGISFYMSSNDEYDNQMAFLMYGPPTMSSDGATGRGIGRGIGVGIS